MLKRILVFFLLLIITTVVAFNLKHIIEFSQANEISSRAQQAILAKNWDQAIRIYQDGISRHSDNPDLLFRLAWLYDRNHQPFLAEKSYRQLLRIEPNNEDALIALMHILEQSPDGFPAAMLMLQKALDAHPRHMRLLNAMGDFYRDIAENASQDMTQSQMADPKSNTQQDYQKAIHFYQQSLKIDPQQFHAQFNLGVVQQRLHNLQPAAYAYCQALLIKPDNYEARYNLGLTLSDLNDPEEAYQQMDRAIQILTRSGKIDVAQGLSLKVQAVKNKEENSPPGEVVARHPNPSFLNKGCLIKQPYTHSSN